MQDETLHYSLADHALRWQHDDRGLIAVAEKSYLHESHADDGARLKCLRLTLLCPVRRYDDV